MFNPSSSALAHQKRFPMPRAIALLLGLVLMVVAGPALAQTDNGRITGVVKDPSGAIVPGATVVLTNDLTGDTRETVANVQGRYSFLGLKPAPYTVKAQLSGFQPSEVKAQKVSASQEVNLDFSLKQANLSETIEVTAEATAIDLSSARMGANVNEREVSQLPINGRQLSQLYLQAPGSVNTGTGTFGDIRFAGRAVQQNIIRYDGVEGSAVIDASPGQPERRDPLALPSPGEPRKCPGIPGRVQQLPGRVRHRHRRPDHGHHQVRHQQVPWLRVRVLP